MRHARLPSGGQAGSGCTSVWKYVDEKRCCPGSDSTAGGRGRGPGPPRPDCWAAGAWEAEDWRRGRGRVEVQDGCRTGPGLTPQPPSFLPLLHDLLSALCFAKCAMHLGARSIFIKMTEAVSLCLVTTSLGPQELSAEYESASVFPRRCSSEYWFLQGLMFVLQKGRGSFHGRSDQGFPPSRASFCMHIKGSEGLPWPSCG